MTRPDPGTPLRVLHLITDLGKGGAERFLLDLCNALRNRDDVELRIGTLFENDEYPELSAGLPIVPLGYTPYSLRSPPRYPAYQALLRDFRPNVVHTHRFLAEFLSAQHASPSVAYVCHGHDNMVQFSPPGSPTTWTRATLTNWLEKRYLIRHKYQHARTSFVANSNHTLQYFRTVLPRFMRRDVHLLPYGFGYRRFAARSATPPKAGSPLRIVNVGSFQPKKNQMFIVRIAERLRSMGVEFQMHLLGDGATRPEVQAAVHNAGLEGHVLFHGNVDRVEEWLWSSHLYLHTATYEPFGLVLLEAMAAGLPCLVLDGKGNRDLIRDGENGFLFDHPDPEAFAERICQMAASADWLRVSARGRAFSADYDILAAADRFMQFYRSRVADRWHHPPAPSAAGQ